MASYTMALTERIGRVELALVNRKKVNDTSAQKKRASLTSQLESYHIHLKDFISNVPPANVDISHPERSQLSLPSHPDLGGFFPGYFLDWEIQFRLGRAFDLLETLRRALGVKSYLTRHGRTIHGSYRAATHVYEATERAKLTAVKWAKLYQKNWEALSAAVVLKPTDLKGLQAIQDGDLNMREAWREHERHEQGSQLPWIWRTATGTVDDDATRAEG